jgi:hypothetical protein
LLFLDSEGQVLASQVKTAAGGLLESRITQRSVVAAVPDQVVKMVGPGHTAKTISR